MLIITPILPQVVKFRIYQPLYCFRMEKYIGAEWGCSRWTISQLRSKIFYSIQLTESNFYMADNKLHPGDQLPHFILNDENHHPVDIASLKGKYLILYFYPKDDTPGCVK